MSESKSFNQLPLVQPILKAIEEAGYKSPTEIQLLTIPSLLEGKDLLGLAQTGTGKTAAFALPLLQNLAKNWKNLRSFSPRALILSPTRELALQIHQNIEIYAKHLKIKSTVIFGGVGQSPQVKALSSGVDIVVATPGRLLDLLEQNYIEFNNIEFFVLDEADQMLDMGFFPDIKRIVALLPQKKQSLFFSATMPPEIKELSKRILNQPIFVEVKPEQKTAEKVLQKCYYVEKENKYDLLKFLLEDNTLFKVLVFVDMKHNADRISDKLSKMEIPTGVIHSQKSQGARQRALEEFKTNKLRVLVATDIAARGIDVDGVTHVINFDVPHVVESYIHRIGRTARAGHSGVAISFATSNEKSFLFAIEKTTRQKIEIIKNHPFHSERIEAALVVSAGKAKANMEAERAERKSQFKKGPKKVNSKPLDSKKSQDSNQANYKNKKKSNNRFKSKNKR